jgi:hypothetical protein
MGVPGFSSDVVATLRQSSVKPLGGSTWAAYVEFTVEEAA